MMTSTLENEVKRLVSMELESLESQGCDVKCVDRSYIEKEVLDFVIKENIEDLYESQEVLDLIYGLIY